MRGKPSRKDTIFSRPAGLGILIVLAFSLAACKKSPLAPEAGSLTRPVIWLNEFSLNFTAAETGADPPAQVIKVKNTGQKTLSYSIGEDADWLTVEPSGGSSAGQVVEHTVTIEKGSLTARDDPYSATITVTCAQAYNNPQRVGVSLRVAKEPPPEIWLSPAELSGAAKVGTDAASQTLRVKNSGKGSLSYSLTTDAAWLAVTPGSGVSSGEEKIHTLSVDSQGLAEGTYTAYVTVSDPQASNNPQRVKFNLTMSRDPVPLIDLDSSTLSFTTVVGRYPSPQTLSVRNSGGGTLNYTITDNVGWLSVSPGSGTSSGQPHDHTVSVTSSALGVGTYQALLTVADPKAANSPQQAGVTLRVNNLPTDNAISVFCSPSSGRINDIITVFVSIKGNLAEISYFGFDLGYDANLFQYQGISRGGLTATWTAVDGNSTAPGTLVVGGYVGSGAPIAIGSQGTLVQVTLKVVGTSYNDGYQSQLNLKNYSDDLAGMKPLPALTYFTYRK